MSEYIPLLQHIGVSTLGGPLGRPCIRMPQFFGIEWPARPVHEMMHVF
jgi:hypothetical protein